MREDFAFFILSHGRASDQLTVKALEKSGYTGKYFIVIDDLDEQKDKYLELYGDKVVIFDKMLYADKTDTITNDGRLTAGVFARNAIFDIAEEMQLRYMAQLDDDIVQFGIAYEEEGQLKRKPIYSCMNQVCEAVLEFFDSCQVYSLNIVSDCSFFGGVSYLRKGLGWNIFQAFFMRVHPKIEFVGLMWDDKNALLLNAKLGKPMLEIFCITKRAKAVGARKQKGGMNETYSGDNINTAPFYNLVVSPSNTFLTLKKDGFINSSFRRDYTLPRILSDRWKKNER